VGAQAKSPGFTLATASGASTRQPAQPRVPAVKRTTTATAIYRDLYAAIVSMQLSPGTALNEKLLTERFRVSRTPVREALIRLVEDGLVDIFPQSGTFVSRIPVGQIPEAVIIRQALEDATVSRAAEVATSADVTSLDDVIARQKFYCGRQDLNAFHEADEAFHEAIAAISGHPGIWEYLKPAKIQIDRCRRLTLPALGRMEFVLGEHQMIRDAIAAHDVEAARVAMHKHLSAVLPDIDTLRSSFPDSFV
jgi:GntR family transcriptional regulator, rspAB operon transcriptional repressor